MFVTQLARQLHEKMLQMAYSNKEDWKRLGQNSRNGTWTRKCCCEEDVLVCQDCLQDVVVVVVVVVS